MVEVGKILGYSHNALEGLVIGNEIALVGRSCEYGHNPLKGLVGIHACLTNLLS